MWAKQETWLSKIQQFLKKPQTSDGYPNDRLPSEQVIPLFALRGYRGPETLVASEKYFSAKNVGGFVDAHVADMRSRNWPISRVYVEQDVVSLEELASWSDAVRVVPAY